MWNNYFSGRPKRDLPPVNYRDESSDEETFQSPERPPVTRQGSPQLLAVPQLNDNVDEELEAVAQTLKNVGHTPLFKPKFEAEDEDEEVVEGLVVGVPVGSKVKADPPNQPIRMVNYDQQNEADEAGAIQNARDVKLPFNKHDVKLWFSLVESKMQFAGLKNQWSKRRVLIQLIPTEFHSDFRQYLQMQEDEAGNDSYYTLKKAIIKQFGPKKADNFDKAISRVMTGTPSQLGRQILADICPAVRPLNGCHCEDIVLGIWRRSLPQAVRNQIADMDFNKNTYMAVFDKADDVWAANKASVSVVSALSKSAGASAAAANDPAAEVAATTSRNRKPKNNKGANSNSGGGSGNATNQRNGNAPTQRTNRGPRHPDNPPSGSCGLHWKFGKAVWTCADRHNCP